eukprot:gene24849-10506_t
MVTTHPAFVALFLGAVFSAPLHASADCPDAGIRCRIPVQNTGSTVSSNGCEGGSDVTGTVDGAGPSGSVSINGKCFNSFTSAENTEYVVIGSITIGQCYDLFQGGCQPDHCDGNAPGKRCNEVLPDCTIYRERQETCTAPYTVAPGDSCDAIATGNGLTIAALQELNPDAACGPGLQVNQALCLAKGIVDGPGTPSSEGLKVSG